jgi:hypothetical protein
VFVKAVFGVLLCLILSCTSVFAQNANNFMNFFGGMMQSAILQATLVEWGNPIQPHPEEPVCAKEPQPTRTLTSQDGHLMSQSEQLKLQRSAATKAERE